MKNIFNNTLYGGVIDYQAPPPERRDKPLIKPQQKNCNIPTCKIEEDESNDRYVKFGFSAWMPRWDSGTQTVDTSANKYTGNVVLPTKDIYDIKVYYSTSLQIDTDHSDVTLISEIKPVVLSTDENRDIVTNAANWANYLNPAFVTYNPYTTNDLTEVEMTTLGKPASASVDNRDVQYGVQTWTPNYNN